MKNFFYPALCLTVIITSCAKEKSFEGDGTGGVNFTDTLISKIETSGLENSVAEFSYDDKNKLIRQNTTIKSIVGNAINSYNITRDASGRVSRSVRDISGGGYAAQTHVTDFYYIGASDTKVKYGKRSFELSGVAILDSILFTYTNNKVTKTYHYYSFDSGHTYLDYLYTTYAYDGKGNIIGTVSYQDAGNGFEAVQTLEFEYDDKVNPGNFKDDALIETPISSFLSPNNPLKRSFSSPLDPSSNYSVTIAYDYRSDGKPIKSTAVYLGANFSSIYTYK